MCFRVRVRGGGGKRRSTSCVRSSLPFFLPLTPLAVAAVLLMSFLDWNKDEWHAFGEGCLYVLLSFAFFRLLQFIVRWYLFGKCTFRTFSYFTFRRRHARSDGSVTADSTTLSTVPPNKKWRICNEVVSLIHAAVSGLWAGYSLLFYQNLLTDMVHYRHPVVVNLILVSTGYLLHDLLDLLINERSKRIIELLFHHVVVLIAFAITQISGLFLGVVVFGLLMELNSVFLHSRSLLNLYRVDKKKPVFRMVALLNMVTLLVFRMAVSVYLMYWQIREGFHQPWYCIVPCFFVISSLLVTNTVLAYRVMAADGLFGKKSVNTRARPNTAGQTNEAAEEEEDKSSESDEEDEEEAAAAPQGVTVEGVNEHSQQLVANGNGTTPVV